MDLFIYRENPKEVTKIFLNLFILELIKINHQISQVKNSKLGNTMERKIHFCNSNKNDEIPSDKHHKICTRPVVFSRKGYREAW